MTIYRNKTDNLLYIIEHVILDYKFLNLNGNAGIRAYQYPTRSSSNEIIFYSQCKEACMNFINANFQIVGNR